MSNWARCFKTPLNRGGNVSVLSLVTFHVCDDFWHVWAAAPSTGAAATPEVAWWLWSTGCCILEVSLSAPEA